MLCIFSASSHSIDKKTCMTYVIWCQHSYIQAVFIYQSMPKMNLIDNMPNWFNFDLISFDKLFISSSKSVFSTHSIGQIKNQPKFDHSLQPPPYTVHSLIVFPFEKFLTDNLKTYGLMDPVNFLENKLLDILKNVVPTLPFSVTTNAVPYF